MKWFLRTWIAMAFFLIATIAFADGGLSGTSIYQLKSKWKTQNGDIVSLAQFRGNPVVAAMIYTKCKDECPLLVLDIQKIEKALPQPERGQVRFVLISFDSDHDTPAVLKRYAAAHGLDLQHWTLLDGSKRSVRDLAAVLGVRYRRLAGGDYSHSSVITVLDGGGVIRYQEKGLGNGPEGPVSEVEAVLKLKISVQS